MQAVKPFRFDRNCAVRTSGLALLFLLMAIAPARSELVWEILTNGQVVDAPTFPYQMHGYEYDTQLGDNDMPWLREYAAMREIFAGVNMSLDWKDREWDMMRAIIHFTSNHFRWDGVSSVVSNEYRALPIIALNDVFGELMVWGCGDVAAAAVGLAQAHGVPARLTNGVTDELNADVCMEMFSTRFNRWVFFFPKGNNWIEDETLGPLGSRELHHFDVAIMIQLENVDGQWQAIPTPPLVFMPSLVNRSPLAPYYYEWWWTGYFKHYIVSTKTLQNKSYAGPIPFYFVCNDDFMNNAYGLNRPVAAMDDLSVNYPLNNVEAAVTGQAEQVTIALKQNMFEWVRFEANANGGGWVSFEEAGVTAGENPNEYTWTAPAIPSELWIRGVNLAGSHSPDVILRVSEAADLIVDGKIDGLDIAEFVRQYLASDPMSPPWYLDFNTDGVLDAADVAEFAQRVLTGS